MEAAYMKELIPIEQLLPGDQYKTSSPSLVIEGGIGVNCNLLHRQYCGLSILVVVSK